MQLNCFFGMTARCVSLSRKGPTPAGTFASYKGMHGCVSQNKQPDYLSLRYEEQNIPAFLFTLFERIKVHA